MGLDRTSPLPLNSGTRIPQLGLGVFRAGGGGATRQAVSWALECGYRHIDTAQVYGNEAEVGEALRASGLARDEVFVTTKLWRDDFARPAARRAFADSLARLGLEYVDLYLLHWPEPDTRLEAWQFLESLYEEQRCRAIGVSNFTGSHLEQLLAKAEVVPAVNQIELHPFWQQRETVEFCQRHDIVVEAWGPLVKGHRFDDPVLKQIAGSLGVSVAQVLIRWSLQKGFVCIPKSSQRQRIASNADVFGFALSTDQMRQVDDLEQGYRTAPGWDPTTVA
jgi:methylglyoxal/glyoxal reductase